jgi:hypothetical protein
LEARLGVLDGGDAPRLLVPPEIASGANWAIRRDVLQAAGGFDAHLEPFLEVPICGEEVTVARPLHLSGLGGTLYAPGAAVGRRISADRLCNSYLVERAFAVAVEHAYICAHSAKVANMSVWWPRRLALRARC